MAFIGKLPHRVQVTTTPAELRKLADKMEAKMKSVVLGETTHVETWLGEGDEVIFHFDQESMPRIIRCHIEVGMLRPGDKIIRPNGLLTYRSHARDQFTKGWLIWVDEPGPSLRYGEFDHVPIERTV